MPTPPTRLLLVDDDVAITDALAPILGREGFEVAVVHDGDAALASVRAAEPDVVVLDVMLPRTDGRAVLRTLRAEGRTVPVLLLTSVGEAGERARALDDGADDYLNKPFDHGELIARVRAVLRRSVRGRPSLAGAGRVRSGDLLVDRVSRRAWLGTRELVLTPKAAALLDYLVTHPDELLGRDRLLEVVWGFDHPVGTRAVDHRVAELRRVLDDDPAAPRWVETVQGTGYRFRGAVEPSA
ncbi:response regulator transcription factor [Actinotalea solisilvae]|uniref:response regulator transcription factor n=1 Tax=Actinotalea solisilvae TaxID=2072922 RepID=UPI0018F2397D|nr:response regulator transcription factor [Actinotalea solisilvae]